MRGVLRIWWNPCSVLRTEARADVAPVPTPSRPRVAGAGRAVMKKDKRGVDGKYLLSCVRLEVEARAEACRRAVGGSGLGRVRSQTRRKTRLLTFVDGRREELNEKSASWPKNTVKMTVLRRVWREGSPTRGSTKEKPARPRQRIAAARRAAKPWNWKANWADWKATASPNLRVQAVDGALGTGAHQGRPAVAGGCATSRAQAEISVIEDADDADGQSSDDDERQLPVRTSLAFSGCLRTHYLAARRRPHHVVIGYSYAAGEDPHPLKRDNSPKLLSGSGASSAAFNRPGQPSSSTSRTTMAIYAARWRRWQARPPLLCARRASAPRRGSTG